jgi:hypothetical protein
MLSRQSIGETEETVRETSSWRIDVPAEIPPEDFPNKHLMQIMEF